MGMSDRIGLWIRRNWFLPVLALLLAIEWAFVRSTAWSGGDGIAEAAVLIDLCLVLPALHFLCYRRSLTWRPLILRTVALAFLGLYLASHLVPAQGQALIPALGWARLIGMAVVLALEVLVLVAVLKLLFGGRATAAELSAKSGAPEWVARLMLAEARFWKWLWRLITGRGRE
jgi:hypothetical protein